MMTFILKQYVHKNRGMETQLVSNLPPTTTSGRLQELDKRM